MMMVGSFLSKEWDVSHFLLPVCVQDNDHTRVKKVGKTTRPFRYDLNQIPYDYTVQVRNRFKGLDLIDRVPDELWTDPWMARRSNQSILKEINPEYSLEGLMLNLKLQYFGCLM